MDIQTKDQVALWKTCATDVDLARELAHLIEADDAKGLQDAFFCNLSFGTAGLRGELGVGTNRMNIYTVGQATQGLANYLNACYEAPTVVLARDSRNKGEAFVRRAASVLAANGIKALIYPRIEPVPVLSFTVRHLKASAGIAVTASHNPAQYNGYKVYNENGCQIAEKVADEIQAAIAVTHVFDDVKAMDFDMAVAEGLIAWISDEVIDAFIDTVSEQSIRGCVKPDSSFSVVYTPLNGSGMECVGKILKRVNIARVTVVPEQAEPDGNFPTCSYPNPEMRDALQKGLDLCDKVKPDLLLATDPDADRVGVAVPHRGAYVLLSGNEIGVLLLDWLCRMKAEQGEDIGEKVVVSTIVSSMMPDVLAHNYGFELRRVLTGFKYVGGQIDLLTAAGEQDRFLMGFEESYGYLVGTHVRDKDGIVASMLICEMASWYAERGLDLYEAMLALYKTYGFFLNKVINVSFPGAAGSERMAGILKALRQHTPQDIAGYKVETFTDYNTPVPMPLVGGLQKEPLQHLPSSYVLEFGLAEGMKVIIRPSGTEPKVKAYLFAQGATQKETEAALEKLASAAQQLLT